MKVEVECQSYEEAESALVAGADVVMLDNFEPGKLKETAKRIKEKFPHAIVEASGGVTLKTLPEYFSDDVDVVSMGGLTQGVPHVDFSLKIKH